MTPRGRSPRCHLLLGVNDTVEQFGIISVWHKKVFYFKTVGLCNCLTPFDDNGLVNCSFLSVPSCIVIFLAIILKSMEPFSALSQPSKPNSLEAKLLQSQTVSKPNCFKAKLFQSQTVSKSNSFEGKQSGS